MQLTGFKFFNILTLYTKRMTHLHIQVLGMIGIGDVSMPALFSGQEWTTRLYWNGTQENWKDTNGIILHQKCIRVLAEVLPQHPAS